MSEHKEGRRPEITNEVLETLLMNDYPQRGPWRIFSALDYFIYGAFNKERVYQFLSQPDAVMDVKDYIEKYLGPNMGYSTDWSQITGDTKIKVERMNEGIQALRLQISNQDSLKSIAKGLREFCTEFSILLGDIDEDKLPD